MRHPIRVLLGLFVFTACGGGGEASPVTQPPPPPVTVASITLDKTTASLFAGETVQLAATPKDASGAALSGRTIAWTSSSNAAATVNASGLVTAVAAGTATITATCEGVSANATITVKEGTVVGANGGHVTADGGAVKIDIPAGAASSGTVITVEKTTTQPADAPQGVVLVGGTYYKLGPDGAHFSSPVTVTLRYDPAQLPSWVIPSDLALQRWDGAQWHGLADVVVDSVAHTVTGTTTGFSTFGASATLPPVSLNPGHGQINLQRRSVVFDANVTGHQPGAFQYVWTTTGTNGSLGAQFGNTMQYIGSSPILPQGVVDLVGVEVRAQSQPGGAFSLVLGQASASVTADLGLTVDLLPLTQDIDFRDSTQVQVLVRDGNGNPLQANLYYEWTTTLNAGTFDQTPGAMTQAAIGTYTAWGAGQQVKNPPRGEKISVKVLQKSVSWNGTAWQPQQVITYDSIGVADAFIEIGKKEYVGRFAVVTVPTTGTGACVYAYVYAPQVSGATQYDLTAYGFIDPGGYGTSYARTWTGPTGSGLTDVVNAGAEWRMGLDGGCSTSASGVTFRQQLYAQRFAGIEVEVKVSP